MRDRIGRKLVGQEANAGTLGAIPDWVPVVVSGAEAERAGRESATRSGASMADGSPRSQVLSGQADCKPPRFSNTGGSSSHSPQKEEGGASVHVDALEFAGRVRWNYLSELYDEMWEKGSKGLGRVRRAQAAAKLAFEDRPLVFAALLAPLLVGYGPKSVNAGHVSLPVRMGFRGSLVAVDPDRDGTDERPNLFVSIPGSVCLQVGAEAMWQQIRALIRCLGGELREEDCDIRRGDVCQDIPGHDLGEWYKLVDDDCVVTRCAEYGTRKAGRNKRSGFNFGHRDRAAGRVYDKVLELESKDEVYREAMRQRRYGGVMPEHATRVEYELRTEWFREHGIKTVRQFFTELPAIVAKLTRERHPFFRITEAAVDRAGHNQKRAGTDPAWAAMCERFVRLAGERRPELVRRLERQTICQRRAVQQAVGVLTSAACAIGIYGDRPADLIMVFSELLRRNADAVDVGERWELKAARCGLAAERMEFDPGG